MSNAIEFLERLGSDAQLRYASAMALEQALAESNLEPHVREAILTGDRHRLESALGAKANVCCAIYAPAREDDDRQGEAGDEPQQDDDGSRDEKSAH
jgi:hypothetical protein